MRVSIYKGELLDQRNTGSYIVEGYRITYLVVEHIYYADIDSISAKKLSGELSGIIIM